MKERRRIRTAQEPRELNLPACGVQQIDATHDVSHTLQPVVDDNGKLIRPVAEPVAEQKVAALFGGRLLLRP